MLNILQLLNYPGRGGVEKYISLLAEKLHGKSCNMSLGYSENGPMLEEMNRLGVSLWNIPMRHPADISAALKLRNYCRDNKIDIVHTHFYRENSIALLSKLLGSRIMLVNTFHTVWGRNYFFTVAVNGTSLFTDGIIAVSNAVRERLVAGGIPSNRIGVIYKGIDADYWRGRRSLKARKELGIDNKEFVVASIARFSEEKRHIFLLEAIKLFKKRYGAGVVKTRRRVRFLLAGEGELLEECRKLAEMLGISDDIVFTGYRSDIRNIYHGCDLYISHSMSDSPGFSILEALSCELPVVAANAGGPAEIFNERNRCGIIVDYNDMEGFADGIIKMVEDRDFYRACKSSAYATVKESFGVDRMIDKTYGYYIRSLTSGHG